MNQLNYKQHLIRKRFGQVFLHDIHIINKIVNIIYPDYDQAIVEIGPGLGALTRPIINRIKHMTVIELDHNLASRLIMHPLYKSKLNVIQQDVMKVDFHVLANKMNKHLRICGNLPYNISTALLFHLFKYINVIHDMHLMFQKEIVKRLIATPNNKNYGKLSIMAQYFCQIIPVLDIPPKSFYPIPKVESTVVKIIPYTMNNIPFIVQDIRMLSIITNFAFTQRRKMLKSSLKNILHVQQLTKLNIDPTLRAENVSVEQYCRLANAVSQGIDNKNLNDNT